MDEKRLPMQPSRPGWTRPDDYVAALARKRTERKKRENRARTQPESPRFSLSTLPFLALIAALILLGLGIMIAAWPGSHPQPAPKPVPKPERGVAAKGWLQEAEKDFH